MCKCLLCHNRDATQTGSHIIPSFLMKRINSIDGCNERDHELGFSIGLSGLVESYFGREVYEDRRREYTDDESRIEDRTNLDTMDNVFCSKCENLFSKYENKYSATYQLAFDGGGVVENTKVTGDEAALFWYGVIWRISVTGQFKVRLNYLFEEKLRKAVMSEDVSDLDVYYALCHCKNYRKDNPTFALFDCEDNVAMLIVDEFMIVFFNGKEATQSNKVLWGMNFKCEVPKLNNGINPEKIGVFPLEVFKFVTDNILRQLVTRIDFRGKFSAMHKNLFGTEMPEAIFQEVMEEISKSKLADMYTVQNYALALKRVLQAHPDKYPVRFTD